MTQVAETKGEKAARRGVDKFAERRSQLAESALLTLSELGYARTSLREIAQHSEFSHGVLHYYFSDKVDLIMACIRQYKARCVTRYDQIVYSAQTAAELRREFAAGLARTVAEDAPMHRLWYDIRTQSMFEKDFQPDVAEIDQSLERMIWRIVSKYAELSGFAPAVSERVAYALYDGLFQQTLLRLLHGQADAPGELQQAAEELMGQLVPGP
ncbi:MAG: TetR/AcrR family transcriptional regulator [Actinomycetota bacterium]